MDNSMISRVMETASSTTPVRCKRGFLHQQACKYLNNFPVLPANREEDKEAEARPAEGNDVRNTSGNSDKLYKSDGADSSSSQHRGVTYNSSPSSSFNLGSSKPSNVNASNHTFNSNPAKAPHIERGSINSSPSGRTSWK